MAKVLLSIDNWPVWWQNYLNNADSINSEYLEQEFRAKPMSASFDVWGNKIFPASVQFDTEEDALFFILRWS